MYLDSTASWLASNLRGNLIGPGDQTYDSIRTTWNRRQEVRPTLIAQCAGTADVITCVKFARTHGVPLLVRDGSHCFQGSGEFEDGLMLDLSQMNAVMVDPELKTAQVQSGALVGDVDHETQIFGLAAPLGRHSCSGISWQTLGGGIGPLSRRFGLTIDNLLAAEVVNADGELVHASETDDSELLWALKGGGGNFGVVTSFEFKLHRVGPNVVVAQSYHRMDDLPDVLRGYREFVADAPDDVGCIAFIASIPPLETFPSEHHGKHLIGLIGFHTGEIEAGSKLLRPVESLGNPLFASLAPMPYLELKSALSEILPDGAGGVDRSHFLRELPDVAISTIREQSANLPGGNSAVVIEALGGAVGRIEPGATAFPHRDPAFILNISGASTTPYPDLSASGWVQAFHDALGKYATGGVSASDTPESSVGAGAAAFGSNLERLGRIKAELDPEGLFSGLHQIIPANLASHAKGRRQVRRFSSLR